LDELRAPIKIIKNEEVPQSPVRVSWKKRTHAFLLGDLEKPIGDAVKAITKSLSNRQLILSGEYPPIETEADATEVVEFRVAVHIIAAMDESTITGEKESLAIYPFIYFFLFCFVLNFHFHFFFFFFRCLGSLSKLSLAPKKEFRVFKLPRNATASRAGLLIYRQVNIEYFVFVFFIPFVN
jgi:hypothetical protein